MTLFDKLFAVYFSVLAVALTVMIGVTLCLGLARGIIPAEYVIMLTGLFAMSCVFSAVPVVWIYEWLHQVIRRRRQRAP